MSKTQLVALVFAFLLGLAGIASAADTPADPATGAFLASLAAPEAPALPGNAAGPAPLFADCGPDFCSYEDDLNCQQSCAGCPYELICNYDYCRTRCWCRYDICSPSP